MGPWPSTLLGGKKPAGRSFHQMWQQYRAVRTALNLLAGHEGIAKKCRLHLLAYWRSIGWLSPCCRSRSDCTDATRRVAGKTWRNVNTLICSEALWSATWRKSMSCALGWFRDGNFFGKKFHLLPHAPPNDGVVAIKPGGPACAVEDFVTNVVFD